MCVCCRKWNFWGLVMTILFDLQVKLEPRSPAKPSRVVHIRNIPNDVTEAEIVHLGIPFGRVTNVLVLKGKNQVNYRTVREPCQLLVSREFVAGFNLIRSGRRMELRGGEWFNCA